MKFDAKNLKINSLILIILTFLSAIAMIGQIMANELSIGKIMELANTNEQIAFISFMIVISLSGLIYLITIFVGIRGMQQANGKVKGKSHIVLAMILLALNMLSLAVCIFFAIKGQFDIMNILQNVIYISFLVHYILCAKNVG